MIWLWFQKRAEEFTVEFCLMSTWSHRHSGPHAQKGHKIGPCSVPVISKFLAPSEPRALRSHLAVGPVNWIATAARIRKSKASVLKAGAQNTCLLVLTFSLLIPLNLHTNFSGDLWHVSKENLSSF